MPGGDRTGPLGQGPMSGRRVGWCRKQSVQANSFEEQPQFGFRGRPNRRRRRGAGRSLSQDQDQ